MVSVYKHTFPDGKVYIGIAENCEARWNNGRGYSENAPMYKAINEAGWENIKHEVLITCATREKALSYESKFIVLYDSENPQKGYNRTNITSELRMLEKSACVINARRAADTGNKRKADELFREAITAHVHFFQNPSSGEYIKLLLRWCSGVGFSEGKYVTSKMYVETLDSLASERIWLFKKRGNAPTYYTIGPNVSLTPFDYETNNDKLIVYPYAPQKLRMILDSIVAFNLLRNGELEYVGGGVMMLKEE